MINTDKNIIEHVADLCVIGGGMAGISAAVSAARRGLKVVLVHDRPVYGGNASSEIRMWIRGASLYYPDLKESGLLEEVALENEHLNPYMDYPMWDAILFNKVNEEKNITSLLNCSCYDAVTEKSVIKSVICWQLTSYTTHIVRAAYYADCSGDSILAHLTGAEFMRGRENKTEFNESLGRDRADNHTMGNSCLIQARETQKPVKYIPPPFALKFKKEDFNRRLNFGSRTAFTADNFWWLELGGSTDVIKDFDAIRNRLLASAYGIWDYIKNSGDYDADNWTLDFVGYLPGKRESLRYTGDYILTQNDLSEGKIHADEVAYGGWPVDDHDRDFDSKEYVHSFNVGIKPYSIPYRCLYSRNIENLFFAGRNISATHVAMSSSRVMATCATEGQAIGIAAVTAKKHGVSPRGAMAFIDEIKQLLREDDSYLLGTPRKVSKYLESAVSFGDLDKDSIKRLKSGIERTLNGGEDNAVHIKHGGEAEVIFASKTKKNALVRLVFDSSLARSYYPKELHEERMYPQRCHMFKEPHRAIFPPSLITAYKLYVLKKGQWELLHEEHNNIKRLIKIPCGEIEGIRLIPLKSGADSAGIFSIDVEAAE